MQLVTMLMTCLLAVSCSTDGVVAPLPGSIKGVVYHPITRSPLQYVQMSTVPGTDVQLTNASGAYSFPTVSAGDYIVKAMYSDTSFSGYATVPIKVLSGSATTADLFLKLGSPENGIISGRVVDASGKSIQGAKVTIDKPYSIAETSVDGSFLFLDVTPGKVNVNVIAERLYGAATTTVQKDAVSKLTITAYDQDPLRGSVTGTIVADKKPLPGAIVSITSLALSAATDANGSYVLKNVPIGTYEMIITKEGLRTRRYEVTVALGNPTVKNADLSGTLPPFSEEGLELYLPMNGFIDDLSSKGRSMREFGGNVKFVDDRFGMPGQAVEFNGANSIVTTDGALMNFKELTIGAWVYIPSLSGQTQLVLGKTMHPIGDGYYIIIDAGTLTFIYAVEAFAKFTRLSISTYPKDKWIWVGFSLDGNGNGWACVDGASIKVTSTANYPTITTSPQQFQVGDLPTTTSYPGFSGKMDHLVVFSRYMTVDALRLIMEEKD